MKAWVWRQKGRVGLLALFVLSGQAARADEHPLDFSRLATVPGESAKVNYYKLQNEGGLPYLHADYQPGLDSLKRGINVTESERQTYHRLSWRWRGLRAPAGGDECGSDEHQDSTAAVYLGWRRGLRWYGLKYVWTSGSPKGTVCRKMRNPFVASDTVVLESGVPLGNWITETVDTDQQFREHFADGDPHASVPDFIGFMILTDGDQTHSPASADYASFTLLGDP